MRVVAKKINNPYCDYITEGKIYHTTGVRRGAFTIIDDEGDDIYSSFRNSSHINGNWTIIGNPAVVEVKS